MKPGTVVLQIERVVAGGYGLARTDEGAVFVRGALPGETVTARPALKAGALRAYAIDILEPHPARTTIDLPPGADLPLEYEAQLPIKQALVAEAMERIGKLDHPLEPIHPSPNALGYRAASQYFVTEKSGLGARATDSDRIVVLTEDVLASEPIRKAFDVCAGRTLHGIEEISFRASISEGRVLVGLHGDRNKSERLAHALEDAGVAGVVWAQLDPRGRFRGRTRLISGDDRLLEEFGGLLATVTVQSFSQINPPAAGHLYVEAVSKVGAGTRALDLYAGAGVLGLHLAKSFEEVIAVEITADGVRRGEADARRLKAPVTFHRGDARIATRFMPADLVAVDPPRAGLTTDVIDALDAPRVLYVSCDPTTWARDVARLGERGYRLAFARPYDFYPFTHHVEVLSILER